jgi:hypothetical protein
MAYGHHPPNENMDQWKMNPGVVMETVSTARDFLDKELAKFDDWNNVNVFIKVLFGSARQFQQCKRDGVGQTTILKFLGGCWKQHVIQDALAALDADIKCQAMLGGSSPDLLLSNSQICSKALKAREAKEKPNQQ